MSVHGLPPILNTDPFSTCYLCRPSSCCLLAAIGHRLPYEGGDIRGQAEREMVCFLQRIIRGPDENGHSNFHQGGIRSIHLGASKRSYQCLP